MQPLVEHRIELAGRTTRALELEGDGAPVLLLHGYADSADTWRRVLDRLARAGRRALAIDLPGFGEADGLDRDGLVLPQLDMTVAAAVLHLAEEAGRDDLVLAGNSLGGCLALRAAEDPALPLAGVVPIAPAGFDHPAWFGAIEATPLLRGLLGMPVPVPERVVRAVVGEAYRQLAFAAPRRMEREVVAAFTAHHRSRRDVHRFLDTGRRLLPELGQPFELARVQVPVLLVWGDRDRMVPHRGSRRLVEALPDTRVELLAGCGHCPQVERPAEVAGLLLAFGR